MAVGDVTAIAKVHDSQRNVNYGTIEGPASYAAGGFALVSPGLDLSTVDFITFEVVSQDGATAAYVARWDRTNSKVQVFVGDSSADGMAEVANTTDLSSEIFRFKAEGRR